MSKAVIGADKLIAQLKKNANLDDVKKVVRMNGSELEKKMKRNASFTKGYQTGETKRRTELSIENDGFTAVVGPKTHYAMYLELGTRYMDAQPFVKPSFAAQEKIFIKDMRRLMK